MIHQTPHETTPNDYEAGDGLVSCRVLDQPMRYPSHSYPVTVWRLKPTEHTRVRYLGNGIVEFLPTNEEIMAFLDSLSRSTGKDPRVSREKLVNKPISRKRSFERFNKARAGLRRVWQRGSRR